MRLLQIVLSILLLTSCSGKKEASSFTLNGGTEINFNHAKGLRVVKFKTHYYLKIFEPNDTNKVFGEYILYKGAKPKTNARVDGFIKIPVQKVAPLSTTHVGFISQLNKEASVAGVTDPFRIYNSKIQHKIANGSITNLGESLSIDLEKIIALSPDMVIESGFPNSTRSKEALKLAGIPVIYTVDWMEGTPLARAEWIRLFGLLYDMRAESDSIFNQISDAYTQLKQEISIPLSKPIVFAGNSFKGVWYLPGGRSYVAQLIRDAGGKYILENDSSTASLPMSFEFVFEKISEADIWINVENETINEMLIQDERLALFNPVIKGEVYNRNYHANNKGANDYFESGIGNPHLILSDLIGIFHPGIRNTKSWYYYKKVKNE